MYSLRNVTSRLSCCICLLAGFCFLGPVELWAGQPPANQRSIGDYRRDVKTFMKLSKSDDKPTQRNAVFNMCALHHELVNDTRFGNSTQVQSFRVVVANRLEAYSKEQLKQFAKSKAAEERRAKLARRNSQDRSPYPQVEDSTLDSLVEEAARENQSEAVYQSALQSYESLAQLSGGPAQVFDYAGGRMGAPWDHGQLLVDLIQNTIDPAFWRDNGGNGTIHYYRPSRILVINGSQRIQELTEDLLWKIRAAN